jgi:isopenicillin N synthase-like dioxygenase
MNLVHHNPYRSVIPQFEERGFALVRIDAALGRAIDHSFALGKDFFARPLADKHVYALPAFVEGYRELGPEYSKTPERPDLTESFSVWNRNRARPELAAWSAGCPLHGALHDIFDQVTAITRGVFAAMVEHWAPGAPELRFRDGSWLQVNYYEPARYSRELLQDPHEDMHLITLIRANAPGLEIEVDGAFVPAEIGENELLVMPGSILSLMTGDRVKPLYHQVRNNHRSDPRSAIMFFVNPEVDQVLAPWISNESNAGVDIVARATAGPSNFGLPTLDAGLAGKGAEAAESEIRAPRSLEPAAQ